ncbi:MAG: L-serine ammonia-lyase, iron-sulfur-dependent, subunit alpha [Oscillospiraceae bacterium]|nr:L-serine ammonia-lyase, iron-sulfur-dependent, subunit alpha [Oscillospiraceae bacterium]
MHSIRELYKIGSGPSSSHTMGPEKAAKQFILQNPDADSFKAILYGSLAKTGKGHGTDRVLISTFEPKKCEVIFNKDDSIVLPHENTMDLIAYKYGIESAHIRVMSIGGGDIMIEGEKEPPHIDVYPENSFAEIAEVCRNNNIRISEYVRLREGDGIFNYLAEIWNTMQRCMLDGLSSKGVLPGGLNVERKANFLYNQRHMDESDSTYQTRIVCSYAFAASEQNAGGGTVVTAPTCGSCGVVPAVLKYMNDERGFHDEKIINALAVAGIIGNVVKENASISGAECGCQAEVGCACSMAAAALAELFNMGIDQIEYAAEVALEHHLGLTCDPICGLVQIPCIERNAVAAMRAINAVTLANFLTFTRKISFDFIVKTMYETGKDMPSRYRETSDGGLAKLYK